MCRCRLTTHRMQKYIVYRSVQVYRRCTGYGEQISVHLSFCPITISSAYVQNSRKSRAPDHKFIVTVMLLLCTSRHGGRPCHSTSRSLRKDALSSALSEVPSTGDGRVVKITAVSLLCWVMSSFKIKCCARLGRSLKDNGTAAPPGYPVACVWGLL